MFKKYLLSTYKPDCYFLSGSTSSNFTCISGYQKGDRIDGLHSTIISKSPYTDAPSFNNTGYLSKMNWVHIYRTKAYEKTNSNYYCYLKSLNNERYTRLTGINTALTSGNEKPTFNFTLYISGNFSATCPDPMRWTIYPYCRSFWTDTSNSDMSSAYSS